MVVVSLATCMWHGLVHIGSVQWVMMVVIMVGLSNVVVEKMAGIERVKGSRDDAWM